MTLGVLQLMTILALAVLWISALVHGLLQPKGAWHAIHRSRALWCWMLVLLGGGVGIVYWIRIALRLRRAVRRHEREPFRRASAGDRTNHDR